MQGTYFSVDLMLINMAPRPGQDSAQLDHIQRGDTRNKKSVAPWKRLQYKVQKQVSFEEPCIQKQVSFEDLASLRILMMRSLCCSVPSKRRPDETCLWTWERAK